MSLFPLPILPLFPSLNVGSISLLPGERLLSATLPLGVLLGGCSARRQWCVGGAIERFPKAIHTSLEPDSGKGIGNVHGKKLQE